MKYTDFRNEVTWAKKRFGVLEKDTRELLRWMIQRFGLSARAGDLLLLGGKWYITHAGLLRLAIRRRCHGIHSCPLPAFCSPTAGRWAFKALVYKSPKCMGFAGYGDADPSNVSPLLRGAEMRIAETRAVNRALRKAYGIGLCSVEEIGSADALPRSESRKRPQAAKEASNNGHTAPARLRDRLCLLIRQHQLDPELVKRYAAHFCGTESLRQASREQVEKLIDQLSKLASDDAAKLEAELEPFRQPHEGAA
jgi:hypothetical protein